MNWEGWINIRFDDSRQNEFAGYRGYKLEYMQEKISITGFGSISPLGRSIAEASVCYGSENHCFIRKNFGDIEAAIAELTDEGKHEINALRKAHQKYEKLDASVLYAIYAAREALKTSDWNVGDSFGINIGSSRGATALFEKHHQDFLENGKNHPLSSPTTTLGNISSWVAQDLQNDGPVISHSITCSTALHALLNGVAWLRSGMATKFLVGGSEAALTAFTFSQMQALRIYSGKARGNDLPDNKYLDYPCQSLDFSKKANTMVLGEGAAIACLETGISENRMALIEGIGYATEIIRHGTSISANAICFQKSMKMALDETQLNEVDVVIMHAPGTIKGDLSERNAIKEVFGDTMPALTSNKWKIGHTFAASGMLNVEMAIIMLEKGELIEVPYLVREERRRVKKVLVNAVGFGGNAVSVLLSR